MVALSDPRWSATVPHLVVPLPDEWLPGLLLRCDAANGWSAGTTVILAESGGGNRHLLSCYRPTGFSLTARTNVLKIAELIAQPVAAIVETTFSAVLQDLLPGVSRHKPGAYGLAAVADWRICPDCIAERQFLGRAVALPLIDHCPSHGTAFVSQCPCGAAIAPFKEHSRPFSCHTCGRLWATFPRSAPSAADRYRGEQVWNIYTCFITSRDPSLIPIAHRLASAITGLGPSDAPWLVGWPRISRMGRRDGTRPLHVLVACLAFFGVPLELLIEGQGPVPAPPDRCTNTACQKVDIIGAGNIHSASVGGGHHESWCEQCGSRYLDHHLYLCYDHENGHGHAGPSQDTVAFARAVRAGLQDWIIAAGKRSLVGGRILVADNWRWIARRCPDHREYWVSQLHHAAIVNHYNVLGLAVPECEWQARRANGWLWSSRGRPNDEEQRQFQRMTDTEWGRIASCCPMLADPGAQHPDRNGRDVLDTVRFIVHSGPTWCPVPEELPSAETAVMALEHWHRLMPTEAWAELSNAWMHLMRLPSASAEANGDVSDLA